MMVGRSSSRCRGHEAFDETGFWRFEQQASLDADGQHADARRHALKDPPDPEACYSRAMETAIKVLALCLGRTQRS